MSEEPIEYEVDWGATRIPSTTTPKRLAELRDRYCIPHHIELLVLEAYKCACLSRPGYVAVSEYLFKVGMCKSSSASLILGDA